MRRRAFIAALGTAALAGCASSPSGNLPSSSVETRTVRRTVVRTRTVTVVRTPARRGDTPGASTPTPGRPVEPVSVGSEDALPEESFTILQVSFNAATASVVDPTPGDGDRYLAPAGQKWVAVQMEVNDIGAAPIDLTPALFDLRVDGARFGYIDLDGVPNPLSNVTLEKGASHAGWILYLVPEGATSATLVVDQDAYEGSVTARFIRNPRLDVPVV